MRPTPSRRASLAVVVATGLALAACGGSDDTTEAATPSPAAEETTTSSPTEAMTETSTATEEMSETSTEASGPVGPACDQLPTEGAGSAAEMAQAPVATAAATNPLLGTLVAAVGVAELGDTLNNAGELTVFAPTDDAFTALGQDTLDQVLADQAALTDILTLHVAEGQMDAAALSAAGTVTTLQGGELEFDGEALTVTSPGGTTANVICANVETANAVVHVIDTVLMPAG